MYNSMEPRVLRQWVDLGNEDRSIRQLCAGDRVTVLGAVWLLEKSVSN